MVAIDLLSIGKLEEDIAVGRFRNEAHLSLLKSRREVGYTSNVDIIIESIDFSLYENGKSNPPIQFYGYVELVLQDCLSLAIPIQFPRQRVYEAVQWEAIRQWRQWVDLYTEYQFHRKNDLSLSSIMGALEIPYEELNPEFKENNWIELPLREIHVKCADNTQFRIEHSQYQPIPFKDPFSNFMIRGKSKMQDGDKDSGLPRDGIQPKRNDRNDPFGGNLPVSTTEELGYQGLNSLSPDNLDAAYVEPPKWVGLFHNEIAPDPTCTRYRAVFWYALPPGTSAGTRFIRNLSNPVCGGVVVSIIRVTAGSSDLSSDIYLYGAYSLAYSYDTTIPSDIFVEV